MIRQHSFYLSDEQWKRLRHHCLDQGVTVSTFIARTVMAAVPADEGEVPPPAEHPADLGSILAGHVRSEIGPIAKPDHIQIVPELPKTRSGKIMRRILRKIAAGERSLDEMGDISTLADPTIVKTILEGAPDV